jgi:hypothetical protein
MAEGRGDAAMGDLEKSLSLLPTADAHFELGTLLESRGLEQPAMEHYRVAATGGEAWLARAGDPLARLEIPRTPERWIAVRGLLDKRGYLTIELVNRAPIAVEDLAIEITRPDPSDGTPRSDRFELAGRLPPGESLRRRTNIGPLSPDGGLDGVQVRIVTARPVGS